MDPACGCGNFLIITYRELRRLELRLLRALREDDPSQVLDVALLLRITVDQFAGIEIEPFPAEISRVSLWLMDHLCNCEASLEFGQNYARIPIRDTPHILCANALTTDWRSLASDAPETRPFSYILGNPPFVGFTYTTPEQKADMAVIFPKVKNLDFVAAWYKKAADLIQGTSTRCAFVSTNSICQGEQVAPLWPTLPVTIDFAYRTFKWRNEASGNAAVHCVIVGFSAPQASASSGRRKTIYTEDGTPHPAHNINAYLVDAPNVIITSRSKAICDVPPMIYGNKPVDGGNLIIEAKDYDNFIAQEPNAAKYIKRFVGAQEFLHNEKRYCLWLVGANPSELSKMPLVLERIQKCREMRLASKDDGARKLASLPSLFRDTKNPDTYIIIPCHSSETREYVPMGFMDADSIVGNANLFIPNATLYHFGLLESRMHMAWMRAVCGRLEMRYRYSKDIVYNNFIWPEADEVRKAAVTQAAQAVLDARARYAESTLADLYDPVTMPPELSKAHARLDALVDKLYGRVFATDADRVAHLFALYATTVKIM